jgi:hypothetical protein
VGRGGRGGGEASVGLASSIVCWGCSSVVDSSLSAWVSGLASSVVSLAAASSVSTPATEPPTFAADIAALPARVGVLVLAGSSGSWVSVAAGFSGGACTRSDSSYAGGRSESESSSCTFVSGSDAGETSAGEDNCCFGSSSLTFGGSGGEAHRWISGDALPEPALDGLEMVSCFLMWRGWMSRAVKKPSISSATTEARGSCGVAGGEYALYAGFGVVDGVRWWC